MPGRFRILPNRWAGRVVDQLVWLHAGECAAERAGQRFAVHYQTAALGLRQLFRCQLARDPCDVQWSLRLSGVECGGVCVCDDFVVFRGRCR